jgi:hypothetical protein
MESHTPLAMRPAKAAAPSGYAVSEGAEAVKGGELFLVPV